MLLGLSDPVRGTSRNNGPEAGGDVCFDEPENSNLTDEGENGSTLAGDGEEPYHSRPHRQERA